MVVYDGPPRNVAYRPESWTDYVECHVCKAPQGSPCIRMNAKVNYPDKELVRPHPGRYRVG